METADHDRALELPLTQRVPRMRAAVLHRVNGFSHAKEPNLDSIHLHTEPPPFGHIAHVGDPTKAHCASSANRSGSARKPTTVTLWGFRIRKCDKRA